MSDTQTTWEVRDGRGFLRPANITEDQSGNLTPEFVPRVNGAPAGSNNPIPVNGQVFQAPFALTFSASGTCSSTPGEAALIIPLDITRKVLHLFNRSTGSETIDVGPTSSVTINGGIPIFAGGGGFTFYGQGASGPFYAISPVGSTPISYAEG